MPRLVGAAVIVTVAEAPTASEPSRATSGSATFTVPWLAVAAIKSPRPARDVSVNFTPVAGAGPSFVTLTVYVKSPFKMALVGGLGTVTARLAEGATVVSIVTWLSAGFSSVSLRSPRPCRYERALSCGAATTKSSVADWPANQTVDQPGKRGRARDRPVARSGRNQRDAGGQNVGEEHAGGFERSLVRDGELIGQLAALPTGFGWAVPAVTDRRRRPTAVASRPSHWAGCSRTCCRSNRSPWRCSRRRPARPSDRSPRTWRCRSNRWSTERGVALSKIRPAAMSPIVLPAESRRTARGRWCRVSS